MALNVALFLDEGVYDGVNEGVNVGVKQGENEGANARGVNGEHAWWVNKGYMG